MEQKEVKQVYWRTEGGEKLSVMEMTEEHFQLAHQVLQKRQLKAISSLKTNIQLEESFKEVAKIRNIKLVGIENSGKNTFIAKEYMKAKELIATVVTSMKRKLKQISKLETPQDEVPSIEIVLSKTKDVVNV